MKVLHCRGFANGRDDRKNNNKARNYSLQYHGEEIIRKGTTQEEYEKFFTLSKSQEKVCHLVIIQMQKNIDITLAHNFNLYTLIGNIKKLMARKNQS